MIVSSQVCTFGCRGSCDASAKADAILILRAHGLYTDRRGDLAEGGAATAGGSDAIGDREAQIDLSNLPMMCPPAGIAQS
jgi:hypothetical protein